MVRQIHEDENNKELRNAKRWLGDDNPFFDEIDRIVQDRMKHVPRVLEEVLQIQKEFLKYRNGIKTGPGKIENDIQLARQNREIKHRIQFYRG